MSDVKGGMLDLFSMLHRVFPLHSMTEMSVEISHYLDIWDICLEEFQQKAKSMAEKYPLNVRSEGWGEVDRGGDRTNRNNTHYY